MKKQIALLLTILCVLTLVACNKAEQEGPPYYFIGEVTEIYEADGKFLVKVIDYENYKFNSDYVVIHEVADGPNYAVGDQFRIEFDGLFLETDPPQLKNVPYTPVKE